MTDLQQQMMGIITFEYCNRLELYDKPNAKSGNRRFEVYSEDRVWLGQFEVLDDLSWKGFNLKHTRSSFRFYSNTISQNSMEIRCEDDGSTIRVDKIHQDRLYGRDGMGKDVEGQIESSWQTVKITDKYRRLEEKFTLETSG